MEAQTLVLACVAGLYPIGLLAVSLLLASERPMKLALSFYAGALTSLFVVGTLIITVLHGAGVDGSSTNSVRGGFRLGLGTAMLIAAWVISHRPPKVDGKEPSWKIRLRNARPGAVYVTGAILYSPSGSYIASVQSIATGKASVPDVLQLLVVISIVLITVEIPLLAYALWPERTARTLGMAQDWIDHHGRQALVILLVGVGGYLVVDGLSLTV
jgi:hypothetical protein